MRQHKSFKEYIAARRITDTPQGDFTTDARQDSRLPDAKSWKELNGYLTMKGVAREVIDAARSVWRQYEATSDRTH